MRIEGAILPIGDGVGFSLEAWCQLVESRPEFRRHPARQVRNPITGGAMTLRPPADAAEVLLGGRSVGNVYWSMSEEPLVNVSIEPSGLPLVLAWAAALGGEFRPDADAESGAAPDRGGI
jgi:hypothetical protein